MRQKYKCELTVLAETFSSKYADGYAIGCPECRVIYCHVAKQETAEQMAASYNRAKPPGECELKAIATVGSGETTLGVWNNDDVVIWVLDDTGEAVGKTIATLNSFNDQYVKVEHGNAGT